MLWFISLHPLAKALPAMSVTPGTVMMTGSNLYLKTSELTDRPNGSHNHLEFPHGVLNVVNNGLSLSNRTIQ